ncbi:MAG: SIMPL domain-containing protein [Bacteroidota bacterium]
MKRIIIILTVVFATMANAQEQQKQVPQINVSGEGKIKVTPDKVSINFGVTNIGKEASEVKKLNDETVDKVMKFIKKFGIATADYQTTNVSLNRTYDYDKKKYNYQASQSVTILLKDISKYDSLMMGLVDNGINNITNVEFQSSKIEEHKSAARKAAITEAKHKAEDYVSVLGQKVGKALLISDASSVYYPQPMYKEMRTMAAGASDAQQETLAVGEIEVVATVTVSFVLE